MSEITAAPAAPVKRRKKAWIPIVIVLVLLAGAAAGAKFLGLFDGLFGARTPGGVEDPGQFVDVQTYNYYSGVVEPQKTVDVQKDANREIGSILVSVGSAVTAGQELFTYDLSDVNIQLEQTQLELNGIANEIEGYTDQIRELSGLRDKATDETVKLGYTDQIIDLQKSLRDAQNLWQQKSSELENIRKGLENASVTAEIDGIVKQINQNPGYGDSTAFMTLMASGAYRIKATVDEMNVASLYPGMPVTVRSRVDSQSVWQGTVESIDMENPSSGQSDPGYYYGGYEGGERATKYYFYVTLESSEGLLLGQHVFVEPQMDYAAPDGGVWEGEPAGDDVITGEDGTATDGDAVNP